MALALPDSSATMPFKMTPQDRVLPIVARDLDANGELTEDKLREVCLEIEREHADQFCRRRERLMQDEQRAGSVGGPRRVAIAAL